MAGRDWLPPEPCICWRELRSNEDAGAASGIVGGCTIDYYFDSAMEKVSGQAVTLWMMIALFTALVTYALWRTGKMRVSTAIAIPIIVFYMAFVLTITIIERTPQKRTRYNLKLFWTINAILEGRSYLISEIIWNIVLFVPIGVLSSAILHRRPWWSLLFCTMLSGGIEVVQLLTHRGLFEFDDIIYNGFGAVTGLLLFLLLRRVRKNNGSTAEL